MANEGSSLSEQGMAALEAAIEFVRADPVFSAATVAFVVLVVLLLIRRRSVSKQTLVAASVIVEESGRRPRKSAGNPIDERFAALRLQTEELDALAPPPRHFKSADRSTSSYQLRRR
jgi:hypothetical protein